MERIKRFFVGRRFRFGVMAAITTALVLAVAAVFNLLLSSVDARWGLRVDLTGDKLYTLSEESEHFLQNLDRDVTIYMLSTEQAYANSDNPYYVQANEIIGQYAAQSRHVNVRYVDLLEDPDFGLRFPQYQLSYTTIIFQCEDRVHTLSLEDLFNLDDVYGELYIVSSKAEQTVTAALMKITMENPVVVTVLEGYGESGSEALLELLEINAYSVVRQNILTEEPSGAATVAVLCNPARDWREEDLAKLDRWLYNNGDMGRTLLYFPSLIQEDLPNLDAFLADWGIAVDEGAVWQTDLRELITYNNYWSFVDYTELEFAALARSRSLYVLMPESRPLSVLFEQSGSITTNVLLEFTDGACVRPRLAGHDWDESESERFGPIPALVLSQSSSGFSTSNVVVSGSYVAIDPSVLSSTQVGNTEYMLNLIQMLGGREDGVISIPVKSIEYKFMTTTAFHAQLYGLIFALFLPAGVLVWGAAVFFRRRYL